MKKANYLLFLASVIIVVRAAEATSVIPPTFDELVQQAQVIFQGDVTDVKSQWVGEGGQRVIVSYVTFTVAEALKGNPGKTYSIRMLGGTVDGETMGVSDAPKFKVGDKDILFVENNGTQFVPLVGIMNGRFHVRLDQSGREVVTTNEDGPLKSVARLGTGQASSAAEATLTPAEFKAAIHDKLEAVQNGHPSQ
jgi:hypothetical protein